MGRVKEELISAGRSIKKDYDIEAERLAENLYNQFKTVILDKYSFDKAITAYIGKAESSKQQKFFDQVFDKMRDKHPNKIFKGTLPEWKEEEKTEKKKGIKKTKRVQFDDKDITLGKIGKKVVYVHKEKVKIKGKTYDRLRDKLGRFASPKKTKGVK